MQAERQWVSYKMTPLKWVAEMKLYNERLQDANTSMDTTKKTTTILKNSRALLKKLLSVKSDVLERIAKQDFKGSWSR